MDKWSSVDLQFRPSGLDRCSGLARLAGARFEKHTSAFSGTLTHFSQQPSRGCSSLVGEAAGVYPCFVTTFRRGPKRCHMASGNHTKMPHAPPVMIVRNKCTPCEVRFLSF